jgi:RNA-binding protein
MNKKELAKLKEKAHQLKPEFNVGKNGFTKQFIKSLYQGFNNKELIKIKLLDSSEGKQYIIDEIDALGDILIVQTIGKIITLYKPNDKKEKKSDSEE